MYIYIDDAYLYIHSIYTSPFPYISTPPMAIYIVHSIYRGSFKFKRRLPEKIALLPLFKADLTVAPDPTSPDDPQAGTPARMDHFKFRGHPVRHTPENVHLHNLEQVRPAFDSIGKVAAPALPVYRGVYQLPPKPSASFILGQPEDLETLTRHRLSPAPPLAPEAYPALVVPSTAISLQAPQNLSNRNRLAPCAPLTTS